MEPYDFKKTVNTALPLFFGNQQQDAAEFYNFLLDKMNEEMNRADKKSTISHDNPPSEQGAEKEEENEAEDTERLMMKKEDNSDQTKILLQKQAIADAKQTLYSEFFH